MKSARAKCTIVWHFQCIGTDDLFALHRQKEDDEKNLLPQNPHSLWYDRCSARFTVDLMQFVRICCFHSFAVPRASSTECVVQTLLHNKNNWFRPRIKQTFCVHECAKEYNKSPTITVSINLFLFILFFRQCKTQMKSKKTIANGT